MVDQKQIEAFIHAAGYAATTPLSVGVGAASAPPIFAAQGKSSDSRPFDAETVAYGGSLAKQITGACAALLARDGRIDPAASIAEWLPELPAWSREIRIQHLIHHTAGLPEDETVWREMERSGETDWTSDGVLAALCSISRLEHKPGGRFVYSSVGYICLAERGCPTRVARARAPIGRRWGPVGLGG